MPCEELLLGELAERMRLKRGNRAVAVQGTISLTDRCNLQCVHCFVHDPAQDRALREQELSTDQWKDILDQIAEAGCFFLLFTGGEVLVRQDFEEIYRYAKRRGLLITLFTNGTLLTPDLIRFLGEWYPYAIEITLYGLTPETYERVTGSASAFDRCMAAVRMSVAEGLPLRLKTMAMTLTKDEIPAMYDLAAELGVQFRHDGMIWQPFHDKDVSELRLTPPEIVAMDRLAPNATMDYYAALERHNRIVESSPDYVRERVIKCGAGYRSFYIDPYGMMGLCQSFRPGLYYLVEGTFQDGWQALVNYRNFTLFDVEFDCLDCELAGLCNRCPAHSLQELGRLNGVVAFACDVAHLRAEAMKRDLLEMQVDH